MALSRSAQVGDMVHDFPHSIIVALDARHCDASESTMRYGLAEVNDAVDRVLVLVDEVALKVLLPI